MAMKADLLEQEPTPIPLGVPALSFTKLEQYMQSVALTLRKIHPTQRAVCKLTNGLTTFPSNVNVTIEFFGHGNAKVRAQAIMISNNSDDILYVNPHGPVTFNAVLAIDGIRIVGGTTHDIMNVEVSQLHMMMYHAGGGGAYALNNSDNGSVNPIVTVLAWTNPEGDIENGNA